MKFGRKPSLTPHQQKEARKRIENGETQRSVARSYNVSQATILRLATMGRPRWASIKIEFGNETLKDKTKQQFDKAPGAIFHYLQSVASIVTAQPAR